MNSNQGAPFTSSSKDESYSPIPSIQDSEWERQRGRVEMPSSSNNQYSDSYESKECVEEVRMPQIETVQSKIEQSKIEITEDILKKKIKEEICRIATMPIEKLKRTRPNSAVLRSKKILRQKSITSVKQGDTIGLTIVQIRQEEKIVQFEEINLKDMKLSSKSKSSIKKLTISRSIKSIKEIEQASPVPNIKIKQKLEESPQICQLQIFPEQSAEIQIERSAESKKSEKKSSSKRQRSPKFRVALENIVQITDESEHEQPKVPSDQKHKKKSRASGFKINLGTSEQLQFVKKKTSVSSTMGRRNHKQVNKSTKAQSFYHKIHDVEQKLMTKDPKQWQEALKIIESNPRLSSLVNSQNSIALNSKSSDLNFSKSTLNKKSSKMPSDYSHNRKAEVKSQLPKLNKQIHEQIEDPKIQVVKMEENVKQESPIKDESIQQAQSEYSRNQLYFTNDKLNSKKIEVLMAKRNKLQLAAKSRQNVNFSMNKVMATSETNLLSSKTSHRKPMSDQKGEQVIAKYEKYEPGVLSNLQNMNQIYNNRLRRPNALPKMRVQTAIQNRLSRDRKNATQLHQRQFSALEIRTRVMSGQTPNIDIMSQAQLSNKKFVDRAISSMGDTSQWPYNKTTFNFQDPKSDSIINQWPLMNESYLREQNYIRELFQKKTLLEVTQNNFRGQRLAKLMGIDKKYEIDYVGKDDEENIPPIKNQAIKSPKKQKSNSRSRSRCQNQSDNLIKNHKSRLQKLKQMRNQIKSNENKKKPKKGLKYEIVNQASVLDNDLKNVSIENSRQKLQEVALKDPSIQKYDSWDNTQKQNALRDP